MFMNHDATLHPTQDDPAAPSGHDLFVQVVADDLKRMDEDQALLARRLVHEICLLGRRNELKYSHKIIDQD